MTNLGALPSNTAVPVDATVMAPYRLLLSTSARATAAAASGTKYLMIPAQADIVAGNPAGNVAHAQPFLLDLIAADLAGPGTTKLRIGAMVVVATAPAITITAGLYPVTEGATLTLGTLVPGSEAPIVSPPKNVVTPGYSADFALPANGRYALGYIVSGTPSASFGIQGLIQAHYV